MSDVVVSVGPHRPERRCIGCGRRALQAELLRLTLDKGQVPAVVVPVTGRAHVGRGAYICRCRACLDRAVQRKAFQRAFRRSVVVDIDGIAMRLVTEAPAEPNVNNTAGE